MPMDDTRGDTLHAVVAFLTATLGWMFLSAILGAALASGSGRPLEEAMATPRMLAIGAVLQTLGTGTIALGLARAFGGWPFDEPVRAKAVGLGVGAGLGVGFLPGWLAARLTDLLGVETVLTALASALATASTSDRALLVGAICIVAPVAEELAFRGFLWHVFARAYGNGVALVASTGLFLVYHLDPVQSPSLLPTALLLGALRWRTGSVWPSVAAHVANNVLAMLMLLSLDPDRLPAIPLWLAVCGTGLSWGCVLAVRSSTSRRA
jgi:hypothetical protein